MSVPDQSSDALPASHPQVSEEPPVEAGHVERFASDYKLISREEAIAQGLKYFFTGKPCYWGHIAPRYIMGRTSTCGECKKINCWVQNDKRTERRRALMRLRPPKRCRPELPYIKPSWVDGEPAPKPPKVRNVRQMNAKVMKPRKPPKLQEPKVIEQPKAASTTELTKWLLKKRAEKAEFDKRWAEHVAAKKARVDARLGEQA